MTLIAHMILRLNVTLFCRRPKNNILIMNSLSQKEKLDENSPKLEEIVRYYLDQKNTAARADLSLNFSQNSAIAFRSNDSSTLGSSENSSFMSECTAESEDSPIGAKRKRKDSKADMDCLPSKKRAK